MGVGIRFVSHLRRGIAGAIDELVDGATHGTVRIAAKVGVTTQTGDQHTSVSHNARPMVLQVLGPGEVASLSQESVVRRWPAEGTGDTEPNLFPLVEFLEADLPWRYTPTPPTVVADGGGTERLSPWLVLLAIKTRGPSGERESELVSVGTASRNGPCGRVKIRRGTVLPDLRQAWAWAHVQWTPTQDLCAPDLWTTGVGPAQRRETLARAFDEMPTPEAALLAWLLRHPAIGKALGVPPDNGMATLTGIPDEIVQPFAVGGVIAPARVASALRMAVLQHTLRIQPALVRSRLLCPRNLEPHCTYRAVLVPTYQRGVLRGLGRAEELPNVAADALAWSGEPNSGGVVLGSGEDLELPMYDSWTFSTGAAGDFEALVQKLVARRADELVGVGTVSARLATAVPDDGTGEQVQMWGALRPVSIRPTMAPTAGGAAVRLALGVEAADNVGGDTVVKPPLYGAKHVQRNKLSEPGAPQWLDQLNLDARWRAAAGLGAEIVRRDQADLLDEAWDQYETNLREENRRRRRARVANRLNARMLDRHVPTDAVNAAGGARSRSVVGRALSLFVPARGLTAAFPADIPRAALNPALLRFQRGGGRVARKLGLRSVPESAGSVVARMGTLSASLNQTLPRALRATASPAHSTAVPHPAHSPAPHSPPLPHPPGGVGLPSLDLGHIAGLHPPVAGGLASAVQDRFRVFLEDPGLSASFRALREALAVAPADPEALAAPEFLDPTLSERLAALSPTWILPGIDTIPDNSVVLVEQNPPFIESILVGACVEMARTLQSHEFPTDLRGTYFRFWRRADDAGVARPRIVQWTGSLGSNVRGSAGVVLLLKGQLLRRYPNPKVYAVRAGAWRDWADGALPAEGDTASIQVPRFNGFIEPDIGYYAFDLTAADATAGDGWFFVFEERSGAPRFGLDEVSGVDRPALVNGGAVVWDNLTWGDLSDEVGGGSEPAWLAPDMRVARKSADPSSGWPLCFLDAAEGSNRAPDAADLAAISRQKPARVAIHATRLLRIS